MAGFGRNGPLTTRESVQLAGPVQTMPFGRQTPVERTQQVHRSGKVREREEGPGPPDATRNLHQRLRAPMRASVRRQQFHFRQRRVRGQIKPGPDPGRLQRREAKAVPLQQWREPRRRPGAERAFAVVQHPADGGVRGGRWKFRVHRIICRCRAAFGFCRRVSQTW